MELRIIKTEEDHKAALREIEALASHDLQPGSDETNRLELLGALVESYEKMKFPIELPDPISAIRFRMEQQGLSAVDLVPFLGSRSRVSEVLSGKRPLSLTMIRALHEGLGIPANVLIGSPKVETKEENVPNWAAFPLEEMVKRGWVSASKKEIRDNPASVVEPFIRSAFELAATPPTFRKSLHKRAQSKSKLSSLDAWTARVLQLTSRVKTERYNKEVLDDAFLTKIARLSALKDGPKKACEVLAFHGVALVFERHLPNTHVDGCSLLLQDGKPVIGMSIRYDRLDNFWFTLLHELVHVSRHLNPDNPGFIDNLDDGSSVDPIETEADQVASEALIPRSIWRRSRAWRDRSSSAVHQLASELGIHPAIIAGRIRREANQYQILSNLIGQGEVAALVGLRG